MKASEIQGYRESAGMTRESLADKLGVNAMTVYRWERGVRKPKMIYLREICRVLNRRLTERIK